MYRSLQYTGYSFEILHINITQINIFGKNVKYKSFLILKGKYNCPIYFLFVESFQGHLNVNLDELSCRQNN